MLLFCALGIACALRVESYKNDPSLYQQLAHNLLAGEGYVFDGHPHTVYPPGFPLLLAGIGALFGDSFAVYVRAMPVIGAIGLGLVWLLLRRLEGPRLASAALLLTASAPYTLLIATRRVGSDLPYLGASAAVLLLALWADEQERGRGARLVASLALALAVLVALSLRSAGIALLVGLGAWCLASALGKHPLARARALFCAPALVLGSLAQLGWMWWCARAAHSFWDGQYMETGYVAQLLVRNPHRPELGEAGLLEVLPRALDNLFVQAGRAAELLTRLHWVDPFPASPLIVLPIALTLVGLARSLRRAGGPCEWSFGAYVCLYLLWPFDEGPRFVLPVFPLFVLYGWRGLRALHVIVRDRAAAARVLGALACAGLAVFGVWLGAHGHELGRQAQLALAFWALGAGLLALDVLTSGQADRLLARALAPWLRRSRLALAGRVLALGLLGAGLAGAWPLLRQNLAPDPARFRHAATVEAAAWIMQHTPAGEAVMAGHHAIAHRLIGRLVVPFPVSSDPALILRVMHENDVRWLVVVDPGSRPYFFPTEPMREERLRELLETDLELAHEQPGYRVLHLKP